MPEFYASAIRKPLSPEVLLDAVADVTGVPEVIGSEGSRAVSVSGLVADSEPLDLLGRCTADEDCQQSGIAGSDLSVRLHLLNGELLNRRIAAADGRLAKFIHKRVPAKQLVSEFYGLAFSRRPGARESEYWMKQFPASGESSGEWSQEATEVAHDFLWSVLNSEEFMTNQ